MIKIEELVYQMVPTLESPYPPLLLTTIDLLIRQSYQKEMLLKSKEEPARFRLCAQIAYERLDFT